MEYDPLSLALHRRISMILMIAESIRDFKVLANNCNCCEPFIENNPMVRTSELKCMPSFKMHNTAF